MKIDTETLVSITEANQNFSKVAKMVDEKGSAVILKNNKPRYVLIDFGKMELEHEAKNEDIIDISETLLKENLEAYKELAK